MDTVSFSKKVDLWLYSKSECSLIDFSHKFGYHSLVQKILGLDESNEKKIKLSISNDAALKGLYLQFANDPITKEIKGNRSYTESFKDLIAEWILDDLTVQMLKEQGIEIDFIGNTSKRELSVDVYRKHDSCFLISIGDNSRPVSFYNSFDSTMEHEGCIYINKATLKELYEKKSILIYRDLPRGKYCLVDFATEEVKIHHASNHESNNKKENVYRYVLAENDKKERDDRILSAEIISLIGCKIGNDFQQPSLIEVDDAVASSPNHKDTDAHKPRVKAEKSSTLGNKTEKKKAKKDAATQVEKTAESVKTLQADSISQKETEQLEEESLNDFSNIDLGDDDFV